MRPQITGQGGPDVSTPSLTRAKAEAHEALYPALARLVGQLEAMAVRKPAAPVPPATRAIAADLLFEAQAFGWNAAHRARRVLPEPAADIGGLATQLGQALALLDAYEAAHSSWNADLNCFAWLLAEPLPIKRLRPETSSRTEELSSPAAEDLRRRIAERLEELNRGPEGA
jgi:hypothetical protein